MPQKALPHCHQLSRFQALQMTEEEAEEEVEEEEGDQTDRRHASTTRMRARHAHSESGQTRRLL
eukprot:1471201-Rhodomonas_salina.6